MHVFQKSHFTGRQYDSCSSCSTKAGGVDTAGTGPRKVAEPPPASVHPAWPLEGQAAMLPLLTSWKAQGREDCNYYMCLCGKQSSLEIGSRQG